MTAGTVTRVIEQLDNSKEVVYLNVDDTNTYSSRKFSTIQAGLITGNDGATSGSVGVSFSGQTATVCGSALSKSNVTLVLWGE